MIFFAGTCSNASNEHSEDSYIGLPNFCLFFFQEKVFKMCIKVSYNYRYAFIHIDAFMNALFEFI